MNKTIMATKAIFSGETNFCTLEDIKAAPSGRQAGNKTRLKQKRPFSLKRIDKLGKELWETPEDEAVVL